MGGEQTATVLATIRRERAEAAGGVGDEEEAFKDELREHQAPPTIRPHASGTTA